MLFVGKNACQDVIQVELSHGTVPVFAIVKLDALAELESVGITANIIGCDIPRRSKGRLDLAVLAVLAVGHQAFVDPVVGKELIGAVNMGIERPDSLKETGASTGVNRYGGGGSDVGHQMMDGIVKLLKSGLVAGQTSVEKSRNSFAVKRHHDGLFVVVLVNIFPFLVEDLGIFLLEDILDLDHTKQFFTTRGWSKVNHSRVDTLPSRSVNPARGVRMRIVGRFPGFGDGEVKVSTPTSKVEICLGQGTSYHLETNLCQIAANVVFNRGITASSSRSTKVSGP
mmetsp:Transcript_27980/g.52494  ORF Transcript_27980/g.52494 Transcript_27980/m.52494 type:complete len:283 (-) Transcript_27980:442-1290(-)